MRLTTTYDSAFASLVQAQGTIDDEIRIDDITGGDLYHGRATDGTPTATASWEIVLIRRNAVTALIERLQYRSGLAWDDRANPANWI